MPFGKVYLTGAGPGDPGLLTLRAKSLLQLANAVLYDALVNPEILKLAPQAEQVYAGKQAGRHSLPQADINALLLDLAQRHQHVVRLKGGDPFVFGRGGEEAQYLRRHGVPFEIVPGISAGIAAPAYAGIPVTHRGLARSATLVTGHVDAQGALSLGVEDLPARGTVVVFMGLKSLSQVVRLLLESGRSAATPAAIISQGTAPSQRVVVSTLGEVEAAAIEASMGPPAVLVVGEVVGLHEELAWFAQRPLAGARILLTHSARDNDDLAARLQELGAELMLMPLLQYETPTDATLPQWQAGDWFLFTSANAVTAFFDLLGRRQQDLRALGGVRLATVGRSAANALAARYAHADAHAEEHEPAALVEALTHAGAAAGARVWMPQASYGRRALPEALAEAGFEPLAIPAYARIPAQLPEEALARVQAFSPTVMVFTNSGAALQCAQVYPPGQWGDCLVASLGAVTSNALRESGARVDIQPATPTVEALVNAIVEAWKVQTISKPS